MQVVLAARAPAEAAGWFQKLPAGWGDRTSSPHVQGWWPLGGWGVTYPNVSWGSAGTPPWSSAWGALGGSAANGLHKTELIYNAAHVIFALLFSGYLHA